MGSPFDSRSAEVAAWVCCLLSAASLLKACGDSDPVAAVTDAQEVSLTGTASLAGVRSLPERELEAQVFLIADGVQGQVRAGCPLATQHRATVRLRTDVEGRFQLRLVPQDFAPVSHTGCPLAEMGPWQARSLRLSATAPADPATCDLVCAAPGASASCRDECLRSARVRGDARSSPGAPPPGTAIAATLELELSRPAPAAPEEELPDLMPDAAGTARSVSFESRRFALSSCAVNEGCILGEGPRRLLVFDSFVVNAGRAPLVIGEPSEFSGVHYDACHQHHHLGGLVSYELLTPAGATVVQGRKQGFCLMDSVNLRGASGGGGFTCAFQGISAGWADVYDRALDCQWVDITDVAPGDYLLRLTVNPDRVFEEADYGNNQVDVPVRIP